MPTTGAVRQPERLVHVDRRRGDHVLDVDAFVDGDRAVRRHAVGDQHLPDRFGRGDEAVDLAVLPARERVALAGGSRRAATRPAPGACPPVPAPTPSDSASDAIATPCGSCAWMTSGCSRLTSREKLPRGGQIHLGPRRDRNQVEPFGRAPPQLAVRMRDQRRAMADRAQAVDGQQHLVLAAAPGSRRVDVKREHYGVRVQSRSDFVTSMAS